MIRYVTIHSDYSIDFDREVNARLEMRWMLYGNLTSCYVRTTGRIVYSQAMIKVEDTKEIEND